MADNELTLDWLIANQGEFLQQFGIDHHKIITGYESWKSNYPEHLITGYFCELLRQASLFNMKHAQTEEEYYSVNIQIVSKKLEFSPHLSMENKIYLQGHIHLNKLSVSYSTLPYLFNVQIKADNCCLYCRKKDKQIFPLEKVIKRSYLPFAKCKNESGCNCSYIIVPLIDDMGNLVMKNTR